MSQNLNFTYNRVAFQRIKRGNSRGFIINVKPILILSIISLIEDNLVKENRIYFNETLIERYKVIYYDKNQRPTPIFKPFYYLTSDGFWHLKWKAEVINKRTPSAKFILDNIEYAYLDNVLWDLLQDSRIRDLYTNTLLTSFLKQEIKATNNGK